MTFSPKMETFRLKMCGSCHYVDRLARVQDKPCCTFPGKILCDPDKMICSAYKKPRQ